MLKTLCALMLMGFAAQAHSDDDLHTILRGTATTPALSGLQVSVMRAGVTTESHALGFAQIEMHGPVPLRTDHKVRVASISKLVVAIGFMRLVDAGQVDLDADVSHYLGWELRNPAFPDRPVSARQLLAHTSSVRDASAYFIAADTGELRDFFTPGSAYWENGKHFASLPQQGPGDYFSYANLNFGLLGTIMERVSGQRFDQYMAEQVLQPLGLQARFDPCAIPAGQRAAAFRKRDAKEHWNPRGPWWPQVDSGNPRCFYGMQDAAWNQDFLHGYVLGSNASLYSPQGGLRASSDDLLVILQLLAGAGEVGGHRLLSKKSVLAMLEPAWTLNADGSNGLSSGEAEPGGPTDGLMTSYGLSVHRIDLRAWGFKGGPELLLGHLGEAYGVLSHALFDPATGDGIATIITGTAEDPAKSPPGTSPLYRVEEDILRWWLGRSVDN